MMKVTIVVCDRCGKEMREQAVEDRKLDLKLRYESSEDGWWPFKERANVELCPGCREAFADWLGDQGDAIEGLRTEESEDPEPVQKLRVQAKATDGEGS